MKQVERGERTNFPSDYVMYIYCRRVFLLKMCCFLKQFCPGLSVIVWLWFCYCSVTSQDAVFKHLASSLMKTTGFLFEMAFCLKNSQLNCSPDLMCDYLKISFIILVSGLPNQSSIRLAGSSDGGRILWVQPREHLIYKVKHKMNEMKIQLQSVIYKTFTKH